VKVANDLRYRPQPLSRSWRLQDMAHIGLSGDRAGSPQHRRLIGAIWLGASRWGPILTISVRRRASGCWITDLVPSYDPRRPSFRSTATPARRVDAMRDFEKSTDELASSPAGQNLKFERADWTSFRTVEP
jgi:hypothetical protein